MRGFCLLLNLLFLALALITLLGWMYSWYLCVTSAEKLLKPIFGEAASGIVMIGFPFEFFGLLYVLIVQFGRDAGSWFFVTLGAVLPVIGIWSIRTGRWR
jgi:hypothetical protein